MYKILCLNDGNSEEIFLGEDGAYWEGTLEFISALVNLEISNCKVKYINLYEMDSAELQEYFDDFFYDRHSSTKDFIDKFEELFNDSCVGYYL